MSYKSKHTGTQVDEAVSKVLNGDIEELSTIKSDILKIPGPKTCIGVLNSSNTSISWFADNFDTYLVYNGDVIFKIHEMKSQVSADYEWSKDGPSISFRIEYNAQLKDSQIQILADNDVINYYGNFYLYQNSQKISSDFITGLSNPDWNAQEGEAGYIENKPLNIYFKKFNEYNPELISQETNADNETTCIYRVYGGWWENCLIKYVNTCYEITTPYQWYTINPYSSGNRNTFHVKVEEDWLDIRYNDYECSLQNIEDYLSISIDDARIPAELLNDAVLKTTPQTLSNADKKQALSNLGIDPVVLKYMCNPYIISAVYGTSDNDLPEELRNIIEDEDGYLTTLALKVLVLNHDGETYSINLVTSTTIETKYGLLIYKQGRFYPEP